MIKKLSNKCTGTRPTQAQTLELLNWFVAHFKKNVITAVSFPSQKILACN